MSTPTSSLIPAQRAAGSPYALKWRAWFVKLTHWEYWPTRVVYAPVFFYYLYCALKARSWLFVSAVNPSMDMGGLFGDSKGRTLKLLPDAIKPKTLYPEPLSTLTDIKQLMAGAGIEYPIICKPDIGERGLLVEKVDNDQQLQAYLDKVKVRMLVQEFITYPIEMGVFYYRHPDEKQGHISSIILKDFLSVTGDGVHTIEWFLLQNDRGMLQLPVLYQRMGQGIYRIPAAGEHVVLVHIGNHCRGTKFMDGNHLINDELRQVFDKISQQSSGIFYGRYDIKCESIEALYRGEGIKIMEVNGAASEPGHIYDPNCSIFTAWRVLFFHWGIIYKIAKANHRNGAPYGTFWGTYPKWKQYLQYHKDVAVG